jgi:SAM-dependent methyltransferase
LKGYTPPLSFDESVARRMRDVTLGDEEQAVAFLNALAGDGPALELAIGTGRIPLPLAATGIRVDGIDISPHVIEQMHMKPGGDRIDATVGDMADVRVSGEYRLIYVVWNSVSNMLSVDQQIRCFENVAKHLSPGGVFVIEMGSPSALTGMEENQYVRAEHIGVDRVVIDLLRYDPATQMLDENHVRISATGVKCYPVMQRSTWPSELDLMARIAGLRLHERYGDWDRTAWTSSSRTVVSVYAR